LPIVNLELSLLWRRLRHPWHIAVIASDTTSITYPAFTTSGYAALFATATVIVAIACYRHAACDRNAGSPASVSATPHHRHLRL